MIRSTDQGPGTWTGGLAFYVNGAGFAQRRHSIEVMRLTNNKVGIGTAAPIGKLHLVTDNSNGGSADNYLFDSYGDNADEGLFLRKASGTVAAPQNLQAGDRIGTLSFVPRVNNLPPAYFTGSQIHAYYLGDGTNALSDLRFYTSGQNERMRVSETGNVGIGGAVSPITRLTLTPFSTEPKITLWNGGNIVNHFGFGVSSNQLNYHVFGATDNHVFFAGGRNGDGVELLRITGTGGVRVAGLGGGGQRLLTVDNAGNLVAATSPPTGQGDNLGDHTATQNLNLATNKLVGNGGSTGLTIASTGAVTTASSVATGGDVTVPAANAYKYAAAKTYSITLGFADFTPEAYTSKVLITQGAELYFDATSTTTTVRAPLHLPQGATITGLTMHLFDNTVGNATAHLRSYSIATAAISTLGTAISTGTPGYFSVPASVTPTVVDNAAFTYYVVYSVFNASGGTTLTLRGTKVTYTVTQAE